MESKLTMTDSSNKKFSGRIWNLAQTAMYLGKSTTWLRKHSHRLEKEGFPPNDPNLGGRDSRAIIKFLDQRCGLDKMCHTQSDLLQMRAKAIANDDRK